MEVVQNYHFKGYRLSSGMTVGWFEMLSVLKAYVALIVGFYVGDVCLGSIAKLNKTLFKMSFPFLTHTCDKDGKDILEKKLSLKFLRCLSLVMG